MSGLLSIFYQFFTLILIVKSQNECIKYKKKLSNSSEIFSAKNITKYGVNVKTFVKYIGSDLKYGRIVYIDNPRETLNVLQPNNNENGCINKVTYKTSHTAAMAGNCEVATNAGFFRTSTKECLGNLINNGKIYLNSNGIKNAHFGIKKDGKIFVGYLSEEEVLSGEFQMLVGGVIWLLRDGKLAINDSIREECPQTQETGSLDYFANVVSARTAIGVTRDGTVALVHVDGKTSQGGVNLAELGALLLELGLASAINLDGGGSATLLVNDTLVGYPSDGCGLFTCERPVTTVICVRAPGIRLPRNGRSHPASLKLFFIVLACLATVLVLALLVVAFARWLKGRRSRLIRRWALPPSGPRLVLLDDDEYVHFDADPLMSLEYEHPPDRQQQQLE